MHEQACLRATQSLAQRRSSGGQFASINRPVAGPTHDKDLPQGKHPLQLYSLLRPTASRSPLPLKSCLPWATPVPNTMLG